MQAVACAFGLIGTFRGPGNAGTAYVKLYHLIGTVTGTRGQWAYVRGAMGIVTEALANVARGLGVDIREGCEVGQVCVAGGRIIGVENTNGRDFNAKVVLSSADPKRTYLTLVAREELGAEFVQDVEVILIESPAMKLNLTLEDLPRFTALGDRDQRLARRLPLHQAVNRLSPTCK